MAYFGKWSEAGVPKKGWYSVGVYDSCENGEDIHLTCEMCDARSIRYVHLMRHQEFPDVLACGCSCAERMADDYVNPRRRENVLKNAARRSSNKKKSNPILPSLGEWVRGGNKWRKSGTFGKVTVFPNGDFFNVRMHEVGKGPRFGKIDHATAEAAMTAVDIYLAKAHLIPEFTI